MALESAITTEWVAMQLASDRSNMAISINSERQLLALFNIAISGESGRRDGTNVNGKFVNGVSPLSLQQSVSIDTIVIATIASDSPKVLDGTVPAISDKEFVQNATAIVLNA
ncbi:hypothetical protein HDU99_008941, partial [Rhizoclosmatium hyalinum]